MNLEIFGRNIKAAISIIAGSIDTLETLLKDETLQTQKAAVEGMEELKLLLKYCELYGISDKVKYT